MLLARADKVIELLWRAFRGASLLHLLTTAVGTTATSCSAAWNSGCGA